MEGNYVAQIDKYLDDAEKLIEQEMGEAAANAVRHALEIAVQTLCEEKGISILKKEKRGTENTTTLIDNLKKEEIVINWHSTLMFRINKVANEGSHSSLNIIKDDIEELDKAVKIYEKMLSLLNGLTKDENLDFKYPDWEKRKNKSKKLIAETKEQIEKKKQEKTHKEIAMPEGGQVRTPKNTEQKKSGKAEEENTSQAISVPKSEQGRAVPVATISGREPVFQTEETTKTPPAFISSPKREQIRTTPVAPPQKRASTFRMEDSPQIPPASISDDDITETSEKTAGKKRKVIIAATGVLLLIIIASLISTSKENKKPSYTSPPDPAPELAYDACYAFGDVSLDYDKITVKEYKQSDDAQEGSPAETLMLNIPREAIILETVKPEEISDEDWSIVVDHVKMQADKDTLKSGEQPSIRISASIERDEALTDLENKYSVRFSLSEDKKADIAAVNVDVDPETFFIRKADDVPGELIDALWDELQSSYIDAIETKDSNITDRNFYLAFDSEGWATYLVVLAEYDREILDDHYGHYAGGLISGPLTKGCSKEDILPGFYGEAKSISEMESDIEKGSFSWYSTYDRKCKLEKLER